MPKRVRHDRTFGGGIELMMDRKRLEETILEKPKTASFPAPCALRSLKILDIEEGDGENSERDEC